MARKGRHGQMMDRMGARTKDAPETNPALGAAIREVVDNQLREGTPPETRQTLDRLLTAGYPEEEARRLIACAVQTALGPGYHSSRGLAIACSRQSPA